MSFSKYHMAYAALMHNIGKFMQRTGAADLEQELFTSKHHVDSVSKQLCNKHVLWTTEFLHRYRLPIEDWDSIIEVSGCHHEEAALKQTNSLVYLNYLRQGDICSSIWDGDAAEDMIGKVQANKVPLHSIFASVGLHKKPQATSVYALKALSADSAFPSQEQKSDLTEDYQALWKAFEEEFSCMHLRYQGICEKDPKAFVGNYFQQYIDGAQSLLEKYTWCIPANTKEKRPRSSLYHHSKNTALIASALYAAQADSAQLDGIVKSDKGFMLIACDLNGIQSYLYDLNPENSKNAAKLLRARSTQVKVIMDLLAKRVIDELNLCHQSIMLNVSGKWFILAPASKGNEDKLAKLHKEIEADIFTRYLGTLSMNLDWSTKVSIAELNNDQFLDTLALCIHHLENQKQSKFKAHLSDEGGWKSESFIPQHEQIFSSNICPYCHRWPMHRQTDESCKHCADEIELGRQLTGLKSEAFKVFKNADAKALIRLGDYGLYHVDKDELMNPLPQTDYFYIRQSSQPVFPLPIRAYASTVPLDSRGEVMDFAQIASQSQKGLQALAIVKGDVDNLSLMFQHGLKRPGKNNKLLCSISEYTTFSFLMDYFFSQVLPQNIQEKHPQSIYTVYAGGDDFCLVGSWQDSIAQMNDLVEMFGRYCAHNPELHFSAALCLMHSKAPLRFVIEETEGHLENAKKEKGKSSIYLFETFIHSSKLKAQMEVAQKLDRLLNDKSHQANGVSKQFLYRLLEYHRMYLNTIDNPRVTHDNLYDSLLHYDIMRNIIHRDNKQNITNQEVISFLYNYTGFSNSANLKHLRIPVCHTIYLNRDNKEQKNESTP